MNRNRTLDAKVLVSTLLALWTVSCHGGSGDEGAGDPGGADPPAEEVVGPEFVDQPSVTLNPNPAAPLAAILIAETDVPARLTLTIDDGLGNAWTVMPEEAFSTVHDLLVLGLRADTSYEVSVVAEDEADERTDADDRPSIVTPVLPDFFPPIELTISKPEDMEPGVTMFNPMFFQTGNPQTATWGMLVMLDDEGEVVWYYQASHRVGDARRLANGNILYQYGRTYAREIDMLGNTVGEWWADRIDGTLDGPKGAVVLNTDTIHHEILEMPAGIPELEPLPDDPNNPNDPELVGYPGGSGDFLALSTELRVIADFPTSETDEGAPTETAQVIGDVIVEFDRDGTIIREWFLLDILDPLRISYDSLSAFWTSTYGVEGTTRDWSHANAVIYDEQNDAFIVSVRHQEAVIQISRATGELNWILGSHEKWTDPRHVDALLDNVTPDFSERDWNYHQHAPMITPSGTLLMFDNGNGRAVAPNPELPEEDRYSRAFEVAIDQVSREVVETWSYGGPLDPWYASFVGDADHLPLTGNVLVADGGKASEYGQGWSRIFEVTRDDPAEIVWEVRMHRREKSYLPELVGDFDPIDGMLPASPPNWYVYRAERISLYP